MNWNLGKNVLSIAILAFVFIGMPILILNLAGTPDKMSGIGLTYQELTGLLGFGLYAAFMFGTYYLKKRKEDNNT